VAAGLVDPVPGWSTLNASPDGRVVASLGGAATSGGGGNGAGFCGAVWKADAMTGAARTSNAAQ
jgi:hypothetical protein